MTDTGNEIINEYDGLVHEKLVKLECNIDDMNAQDFEPVTEKLFKAGALDVWTESIYMKKGRPAVKFCCLAKPDNVKEFVIIILKNTSSQGVRLIDINRARLNWRIEKFKSSLGEINIKFTFINDEVIRKVPEYEDLKRLAGLNNLSMFEVRNLINNLRDSYRTLAKDKSLRKSHNFEMFPKRKSSNNSIIIKDNESINSDVIKPRKINFLTKKEKKPNINISINRYKNEFGKKILNDYDTKKIKINGKLIMIKKNVGK